MGPIPPRAVQAIRKALRELEAQPYWKEIQAHTEKRLAKIIEDGIRDGLSNHGISVKLREELGGYAARSRALMIARTEATGARTRARSGPRVAVRFRRNLWQRVADRR